MQPDLRSAPPEQAADRQEQKREKRHDDKKHPAEGNTDVGERVVGAVRGAGSAHCDQQPKGCAARGRSRQDV